MKKLLAIPILILMVGCSITTKQPREDLAAENAAAAAQIAVRDVIREEMNQRAQREFWLQQLLGQGNFDKRQEGQGTYTRGLEGCLPTQCGRPGINPPIYLPQPQPPVYIPTPPNVWQPPTIQPIPPSPPPTQSPPMCIWTCDKDGVNCGWHCSPQIQPISMSPIEGETLSEDQSFPAPDTTGFPQFHYQKG
jgi:hypothetical protein